MILVARVGTFGAAAERAHQTARAALEYILIDVIDAGPRKTARVVVAECEQRRVDRRTPE